MSGTKSGGLQTVKTNIKRYGKDYYSRIGRKGGLNGHTGGTYGKPVWASKIGTIGGSRSKRGHKYIKTENGFNYYIALNTGNVVKYSYDNTDKKENDIN